MSYNHLPKFGSKNWLELILFWILVLEIDLVWMRAQTPTLPSDIVHNDDHLLGAIGLEEEDNNGDEFQTEINRSDNPDDPNYAEKGHKPGGLPMMSDSVFSLIILVYVSVAFCIVFFLFCWKASNGRGSGQPLDFKQQCPLMTNELQDAMAEAKAIERNHREIVTPSMPLVHIHSNLSAVNEEKETSSA